MKKMKVAIIGGGVSGLSLAYYLNSKNIDFVLFEKEKRLGGNACTRNVVHNGKEKYVDMAVNDFNPYRYGRLLDLLGKTNSSTGRVNVNTTFFSPDRFLFKESELEHTNLTADIERFKYEAMEVAGNQQYDQHSVRDYFEEKGYSAEFLSQYLYPRVQGLFFYPPDGIGSLPVQFVMNFYALQAGFNYRSAPASKRFNFKGGAGAWIKNLAKQLPVGKIIIGSSPVILKTTQGFRIKNSCTEVVVDKVVFACHADDLCKGYRHVLTTKQLAILSKVKYAKMVSVAHCDTAYLPVPGKDASAYNCLVRDKSDPNTNYTITYNCNEHQNLSNGGVNSTGEGDLFFVTVNPTREIASEYILRDESGAPLVKEFSRNICDFDLLQAQKDLQLVQGKNGLYFTGGYTNGIGLHENCLKQSAEIAALLYREQEKTAAQTAREEVAYEFA